MRKKNPIYTTFKSLLLAILIVFIINKWFFKPVQVVGNSMYPNLQNGQHGFSSVINLNMEDLQRFDVVVVKTEKEYLVKRVIGLPNEKLEFRNDKLYINDQEIAQTFLDQAYVKSMTQNNGYFTNNFGPIQLSENEYFLMGDNRPVSIDSRYPQYGPFQKEDIISKDMMIFWPFNQFEWIGQ